MMTKTDIQTVLDALHIVDSCVGLKNYFHDKPDGTEERLDRVVDDAIAILKSELTKLNSHLDAVIADCEKDALAEPSEPVWLPSTEWTPCMKLPVVVHVRKQREGESHVSTREGITPVKPDDLIMRGVSGEEYPIGREIFEKTYRIGDTHPAPSKPEPLLDSDIVTLYAECPTCDADMVEFARAIEQAVWGKCRG